MDASKKWDDFYSQEKREVFYHFSSAQIDEIVQAFPAAKKALDVGCGEGQLMKELENRGFAVTGVDPSSIALKKAREYTQGVLKQGTFEEISFEGAANFDLIFVKFVLAFVQDYSLVFQKINALLPNNGGLVIVTPVIGHPKNDSPEEEIFVEQKILDEFLPKYFKESQETVIHKEGDKKLSFFICKKTAP